MTDPNDTRDDRGLIIRTRKAPGFVGLPPSTFYDFAKRDDFPRKVKLGPRTTGYFRNELEAWVRAQAEKREAA